MDLNALEKEIQRLADIEAIKQLQFKYAEICDDMHNPDRICSVFTEDAVWDGGAVFGAHANHAGIRKLFERFHAVMDFSQHNMLNGCVTVNDDGVTATGTWYLLGPYRKTGGDDYILCAKYNMEYVKVDGQWLIKRLSPTPRLAALVKNGWKDELIQSIFG